MGTFPGFSAVPGLGISHPQPLPSQISQLEAGNALPWVFIRGIEAASVDFLPKFDPFSQEICVDRSREMLGNGDEGN